ncbi:MAG: acetoacetate--CoA ligase [Nitrososphaerales archaeon]
MAGPKTLWEPSQETVDRANMTSYARWLESERGVVPVGYPELWAWSTAHLEEFWESIADYFGVALSDRSGPVLESRTMPGARWFPAASLNYAEQTFRGRDPSGTAILTKTEAGGIGRVAWGDLERRTAAFAASLRGMGIGRGDRVAAYLPNGAEAVEAFLACASIVVVVTHRSAIPANDGRVVVGATPGGRERVGGALEWDELVRPKARLEFERVPFEHPLWILYSSGTTGLPKPLVHGHGGILLEHLKTLSLHNDLGPSDTMFWYTSTGWMMWNYLVGALMLGSRVVLYEGDPLHPGPGALWDLADEAGITFLGASAAFVGASMRSGAEPLSSNSLRELRGFGSTGSALSTDGFEWLYAHVKRDLWVASISGGSDLCTAFVGGCPTLPVRSGEIQCRNLGADVAAFDESGREVVGEMGELVIRQPMPSMPLFLWGDESGERYRESYFGVFPGVWRHGDWISVNADGSCVIYGRSDATLKRMGVRVGTSEVYRVVESIPSVADSLVVDMEFLGGRSYMPLFVVLRGDARLDERLRDEIARRIRAELSPRLVPDEVVAVPEIPRTLSGKKVEVPVKRILLGSDPSRVYNPGSLRNPSSMQFFLEFARRVRG